MSTPTSTLHLVATPIGNLGDLSARATDILAAVELVCCEDTRRTGKLLQHAGVRARRLAVCNEHTESSRITEVIDVLDSGGDVALVSDAGTPGVSDPGERLVRAVIDAGHRVSPVPGPVAAIAALVASGLPTDRFVFEGFLPRSGSARRARLDTIASEVRTTILYEAPHRIERTIAELTDVCGPDRRVAVARELTKLFEDIERGTLGEIELGEPRGEYVVVLDGAPDRSRPPDDDEIRSALRDALAGGASTRDAVASVSASLQAPKRSVYALALALGAAHTESTR